MVDVTVVNVATFVSSIPSPLTIVSVVLLVEVACSTVTVTVLVAVY